jgi:hypothetical protein
MSSIANSDDNYYDDILQEIDKYAPKKLKFYEQLKDVSTRESMSKVFPGQGGGSGSAQGIANMMRVVLAKITGGASLTISSPLGQQYLIRGGAKLPKATKKLIGKTDVFTPGISRAVTGTNNQGGQ